MNESNEILFHSNHFSRNSDFECEFSRKNHFDTQRDDEIVVNCYRNDDCLIFSSVIRTHLINKSWRRLKSFVTSFHINKSDLNHQIQKTSYQKYSIKNRIRNFVIRSKFSFFWSNSNHLSSSKIFQNQIYFTSNSIILF